MSLLRTSGLLVNVVVGLKTKRKWLSSKLEDDVNNGILAVTQQTKARDHERNIFPGGRGE